MSTVMTDPEWDDGFEYDEYPDTDDVDDPQVLPCPECGTDIYEDSEQCPACGQYVTFEHSPWTGRPTWWIVLGVLGVIAVTAMLSLGV